MVPLPLKSELQPEETVPIKREEARHQARVVAGLRRCWAKIEDAAKRPIIFHIPNGGSRDAREASNLKVQGVLAGVPDLCLVLPYGRTVWIEMKAKKGRVSLEQAGLRTDFASMCHTVITAYSAEQALDLLREVLHGTTD